LYDYIKPRQQLSYFVEILNDYFDYYILGPNALVDDEFECPDAPVMTGSGGPRIISLGRHTV
jgi:hypothetical protein